MRECAGPTVAALAVLSLLILAKDILSFTDFIINRGFGVNVVTLILFYEIVPLASRTLPFALLIGALVGLGRLRRDRELVALEAAGIASQRLVGPVLAFATVMMAIGLLLSVFAAPWATRSLATTLRQMAAENPGLSLRAGSVREFNRVKLAAREVSADGKQLRGVLLWVPERGQTVFAEQGEIAPEGDGAMQLVLHEGVMLRTPRVRGEETRFQSFFQPLQERIGRVRKNEDFLTETPVDELTAVAWGGTEDQELARRAQSEFHRRLSYPAATLCFGLLAVPLTLTGYGFSRAAGGVIGLLVTLLYYGLMQLGDGFIQAGVLHPSGGVWLPNLVVTLLAAMLLWREKSGLGRRRLSLQQQEFPWLRERQPERLLPWRRYILQRYVARQYLLMALASFAVLFVGYLLVDILERLEWFARYHADMLKALRFYSMRAPLLASRIVPMALLLAATLTVSALSVYRELIGMRACGVSGSRALIPILLIASLLTPLYFVLNEVLVPKTNALAERIKNREIKNRSQASGSLQEMLWFQAGARVYQAEQLNPHRGEVKALSIYTLGANGLPVERIDAAAARHLGDGLWELSEPSRIAISEEGFREMPAETRMQLGEAPTETVDALQLGVRELAQQIHEAEAQGYDASVYRVDFHAKLAAPVACIVLPAVALFFAVSGPPFPGPALTLLVSAIIGIGHVLMTGLCASLGYGGFLTPSLAGWVPALGWIGLAGFFARRKPN
jgi:lipopolysaccharide export system permease protein